MSCPAPAADQLHRFTAYLQGVCAASADSQLLSELKMDNLLTKADTATILGHLSLFLERIFVVKQ